MAGARTCAPWVPSHGTRSAAPRVPRRCAQAGVLLTSTAEEAEPRRRVLWQELRVAPSSAGLCRSARNQRRCAGGGAGLGGPGARTWAQGGSEPCPPRADAPLGSEVLAEPRRGWALCGGPASLASLDRFSQSLSPT